MYKPTATSSKDFTVAIVGGGICGLACAVGLMKAGVEVDLYEAAARFGEIGAGVGLGPNAVRALERLGILSEVLSRSEQTKPEIRPFTFLSGLGDHERIYDYPVDPKDVGLGIHSSHGPLNLKRAAFLDSLTHLCPSEHVHFNKRCVSVSVPDANASKARMEFSDGTFAEADVVLGADGIRSSVRNFVVQGRGSDQARGSDKDGPEQEMGPSGFVRAVFTNAVAYRGLVPTAKLAQKVTKTVMDKTPICWTGNGKHMITFPIKGGSIINVVVFTCTRPFPALPQPLPPTEPWVTQHTTAELLSAYADWGPDARALLSCMDRPSAWRIHAVHPTLDTYVRGRVALLGDAAHGMLPHLGAGAGQGLEDVLLLVRLLAHAEATHENVESILQIYDIVRRPRANAVLAASAQAGDIYEGYGPSGASPAGMRNDLDGIWEFWHHDLDADFEKAVSWLREARAFS